MRQIILILIVWACAACETNYNIIDTGLANGRHDCSMYEYFKNDPRNWDSLRLMIERADLVDLFEGKREGYKEITFFGPVNYAFIRYMIKNKYNSIQDIPVEICKDMVMRHVVVGKYMRDEIERGIPGEGSEPGDGGQYMTGGIGNQFWIYSYRDSYNNVPDAGAVFLYIVSLSGQGAKIDVASTNIEPNGGVVHSLSDVYELGTL